MMIAKTVTANQVWDYCTNDREIPVGSLSYECQSTGNNRSCAEADSSGVALRCNFVYEFDEDSCPRRAEGNANCDKNTQGVGVINIDDFDIWRREYLKELNTTSADFVDPAGVGLEDFDKWRITFTSN